MTCHSVISNSSDPMDCSWPGSLSFTSSRNLLKLVPVKLVMPSNHLILCCPLLLLPWIFPSIRVFSNESVLRISSVQVQFSHSVVSGSLRSHGPQHTRPPCLSPTPGVYPNSCPLSQWCHPTISSSVIPFFSCPQSFPASRSFQMSLLLASTGQSIRVQLQHWSFQWTLRTDLL